ncbi:patatin-like phospholipase family protein [Tellurirhabdus bombi]|uniref:patatin-like phospholipase family protein n=1 Tax=Tellurirhabdus bombi TaxID=2907205 RepID=UPI001F341486|nr:patatin-like phospholipase family protein [Tellurirhabdus bombi]
MSTKLRILSIDGGGTRGVIPAAILNCIQQDTGKTPTELFDLIIGTSTGGIIGIGLFFGIPTEDLLALYLDKANDIFYDDWLDDLKDLGKKTGADYSNEHLTQILKDLFGDTTLGQVHDRVNRDVDFTRSLPYHGQKILMVPSFDLNPIEKNEPINFRAVIFNSFLMKHKDEKLVDLALRTSAGPTYFPIYDRKYIDGGVALNHPAMAAVAFAINANDDPEKKDCYPEGLKKGLGLGINDLHLFSIGCGTSNQNNIPESGIRTGDWGEIQWVKYLPDLLTESNVQVSDYYVRQVLPQAHYHRINLSFNSPKAPAVIRNEINKKPIGLDEKRPAILRAMKEYAEQYYTANKAEILGFLGI